jgi:hypothetical protein
MTSDSTAKAKRSEATDARRLAPLFPLETDRENLLRHAKELEGEADALDLQAAAAAEPDQPPVEQQQGEPQQAEQQQAEQQQADRQEPEAEANAADLQAAAEAGFVDQQQAEQQQQQSGGADGDQGAPPPPKPG